MGKKPVHKPQITLKKSVLPFVSVCTPTFNRRPFIPYLIKCFQQQTYPKDRMEWIIVDDGSDPVGEFFKDIPQARYFYEPQRMVLGRKRNFMHDKCKGDIIVYMDDDDYYPPERVEHAVSRLQQSPGYLVAGSSEMHIFFTDIQKLFQVGPYGPNHATAATFAFRKELLQRSRYDDTKALAEESQFLQQYSYPMIQLDTRKTILVFSHCHNTFDKRTMLQNMEGTKTKPSPLSVDDFMSKEATELREFYTQNINAALTPYEAGRPENKPEAMKQIELLKKEREDKQKALEENQVIQSMQQQLNQHLQNATAAHQKQLEEKNRLIAELLKKVKDLTAEVAELKKNSFIEVTYQQQT